MANINRDPKKGKTFKPQDFMPSKEKPHEQTPEEMFSVVRQFGEVYQVKDG